MINLYVLNLNLRVIGIVEDYQSLIWVRRYNDVGTCEIAVAATAQNIALLQKGFYIFRKDDEMVCRIQKIEIETNPEKSLLIVTGGDVTGFFDQRIMAGSRIVNGRVENAIRQWISNDCLAAAGADRQFLRADGAALMELGDSNSFPETTQDSVGYSALGAKIKEYCKALGWGYRLTLDFQSGIFVFSLYKGTDRSNSVMFSPRFDNLASSKYSDDITKMGNVAVVSYQTPKYMNVSGDYGATNTSVDRYEVYVDGSKINREMSFAQLKEQYPPTSSGGTGRLNPEHDGYIFDVSIQIYTAAQKAQLLDEYSGTITVDPDTGVEFFNIDTVIADLPDGTNDKDTAVLRPIVYDAMLLAEGYNVCQNKGELISFEGSVIPNITFVYKKDYFLGDIVRVENEFGISANARITEVLEAFDENGYKCEPKFQYLEE